MRQYKRWTKEEREQLRLLFPDLPNKEIASRMNRSLSSIRDMAATLSLRKGAERLKAAREAMHEKEARARGYAKWIAVMKADRLRWKNGLEQKTAIRFSSQTEQKRCYRFFLRKHGYIEIAGHKNVVYYDENTRRNARCEAHAFEKYHIKTLPL